MSVCVADHLDAAPDMTDDETQLRIEPGTLLLSAPSLLDPNFMHTVVLMIQHDDDGAFGLVVNRATEATLGDLLPEHPELGAATARVHGGGPVGLDTLQVLHRAPEALRGGIAVSLAQESQGARTISEPGLHLGADLEDVAAFLSEETRPERLLRFVVGYAGWGAGQLDAELRAGSWIPRALDLELVFSGEPAETVWRRALRSLGDSGVGLASQPPDPTWN